MTQAKRSVEFAWLTLAGIPGFIWCTLTHACMCGHLAHDDPPGWRLYADGGWAAAFVAAAIAGVRSEIMSIPADICLLLFVVVSRLVFANSGLDFSLFDVPAAAYLTIHAAVTLFRVQWERKYGTT